MLAADARRLLHVERGRVGTAGELGVGEVEAGVDEADRHARARRRESVDADLREPPLVGLQRVDRVGGRRDPVRPLGLREHQGTPHAQPGHNGRREARFEAPEVKLGVDLLCAGEAQRDRLGACGTRGQLDERRGAGVRGRGGRRRRPQEREAGDGEG